MWEEGMKVVKWILGIVLILLVAVVIVVYGYLRATLPDYDGEVVVSGIDSDVTIIRDDFGMPHIYADSEGDAYFALGYCIAQDRLFQLDLIRRVITGRLSEIMGESVVDVDKLFRTLTASRSEEEIVKGYPPEVLSALEAFASGINYYIENGDGPLPVEFKILGYKPDPWKVEDCVSVYYFLAWQFNGSFKTEMLRATIADRLGKELTDEIFSIYPENGPTIMENLPPLKVGDNVDYIKTLDLAREIMGFEGGGASNHWVVSSVKSKTGKPIFANDPHVAHGAPGVWYEAHIITPTLNVTGAMLPGVPFVFAGTNGNCAWGGTVGMVDDSDYYIEKLDPENPNRYLFKGKWEEMEIKEETIKVKNGDDVDFNVRLTRHGPVIDDVNNFDEPEGHALSMRWVAPERADAIVAIYHVNRAKTVYDFDKWVELFQCPGINLGCADDKGNIGYWLVAGIPIRRGFDGSVPVPGWDGNHEWAGYVPKEEQPKLINPPSGWIATANNRIEKDGYPYVISNCYASPDRYIRISEMLTEKDKLDSEDFARIQGDAYVVLARDWVPTMIEILSEAELSEREAAALELLEEWDFVATPESCAASVFHATTNSIVERTFKKRLGDELYPLYVGSKYLVFNSLRKMFVNGGSTWFDDPDTEEIEDINFVVTMSFKDAVSYLEEEMGKEIDDWSWGDLHTLTIYHPFGKKSALMGKFFNIGPFPMGGGLFTVSPATYRLTDPWEVYHGASLRYIVDLSDENNSKMVTPNGVSGNFMSPHYDDQTGLWLDLKYRPLVLSREGVEKNAEYNLVLKAKE
jgi:penicillin amidase